MLKIMLKRALFACFGLLSSISYAHASNSFSEEWFAGKDNAGNRPFAAWCLKAAEHNNRFLCEALECVEGRPHYAVLLWFNPNNTQRHSLAVQVDGGPVFRSVLQKASHDQRTERWLSVDPVPPAFVQALAAGASATSVRMGETITNQLRGSARAIATLRKSCGVPQPATAQQQPNGSANVQASGAPVGRVFKRTRLSQTVGQFINFISRGNIAQAREIAQLGDLNPNSIAGAPAHLSVFYSIGVNYQLAPYRYLFQELRLNPNHRLERNPPSYAFLCKDLRNTRRLETVVQIIDLLRQAGWREPSMLAEQFEVCVRKRYIAQHPLFIQRVLPQLLQAGLDPNGRAASGDPYLCLAARAGAPQIVQALLEAGATIPARWMLTGYRNVPHSERTILSCLDIENEAAFDGAVAVAQLLKARGVNLSQPHYFHIQIREQATLVQRTLRRGRTDQARLLQQLVN